MFVDKIHVDNNTCPECKIDAPDSVRDSGSYYPWCGKSCFRIAAERAGFVVKKLQTKLPVNRRIRK